MRGGTISLRRGIKAPKFDKIRIRRRKKKVWHRITEEFKLRRRCWTSETDEIQSSEMDWMITFVVRLCPTGQQPTRRRSLFCVCGNHDNVEGYFRIYMKRTTCDFGDSYHDFDNETNQLLLPTTLTVVCSSKCFLFSLFSRIESFLTLEA